MGWPSQAKRKEEAVYLLKDCLLITLLLINSNYIIIIVGYCIINNVLLCSITKWFCIIGICLCPHYYSQFLSCYFAIINTTAYIPHISQYYYAITTADKIPYSVFLGGRGVIK